MVLHQAVGVVQVQEEPLEEELQMRSTQPRVVVFGQAGQPQAQSLQSRAAHLLAAVVQTLQKLCGETTRTCVSMLLRFKNVKLKKGEALENDLQIIHVNVSNTCVTRVDLVESLRLQARSYESEYGGQRATSHQSAHLRVLLQGRQNLGPQLVFHTQQLQTEQTDTSRFDRIQMKRLDSDGDYTTQ